MPARDNNIINLLNYGLHFALGQQIFLIVQVYVLKR